MNKKLSIYLALSVTLVSLVVGTIVFTNKGNKEIVLPVSNITIEDDVIPVVLERKSLEKPYNDDSVYILSHFYDYKASSENQVNSIIIYDNVYMQNTGIIYASDTPFDILAVASGEVISVTDSELTGKVVEIRHTNDIISVYKFLSDVNVKANDKVNVGDKIGTSGISNITDNTKNQLYFEFIIRGELVNGENYYGKNIEEL